jgi:hypothetical protein
MRFPWLGVQRKSYLTYEAVSRKTEVLLLTALPPEEMILKTILG